MSDKAIKTRTQHKQIAIIGLGPMGRAITRSYLSAGYSVTVWNRTKSKAEALANEGAIHAEMITEALEASELIILSLTEYDVMYQVLNPVVDALNGRVLVNLSSDTPEKAREAAKWAEGYGAGFLTGGVMADPPMVGQPEAYVFYSGVQAVFNKYQAILEVLGKGNYLGSDPGLALLYYQAQLDILFTCAAGIMHAIALIRSANITAAAFDPYLNESLATLPYFFKTTAEEVDKGQYDGSMNNMIMMAAGMDHIAQASKDAGIDAKLPNIVKEIFNQTVSRGYGKNGLNSIIEILKKPNDN